MVMEGYQLMEKDPTEEYNKTRSEETLKKKTVSVIVSENTVAMNPISPKLKGLVKLHKEARPIKPLVNELHPVTMLQVSEDCCRLLEGKLSV